MPVACLSNSCNAMVSDRLKAKNISSYTHVLVRRPLIFTFPLDWYCQIIKSKLVAETAYNIHEPLAGVKLL